MTQQEFFTVIEKNKNFRNLLISSSESDTEFYFALGQIYGILNIKGWESDLFIEKLCKKLNIEF